MLSAAAVLVCALGALGRPAATLPPIQLVDMAPPEASRQAEAFVLPGSRVISLLTTSAVFQIAQRTYCQVLDAVRKLASIIAHEEWHVLHGPDERGAYQAQLMTLLRLGTAADSSLYASVVRSMHAALASRARAQHLIAGSLR